MATYERLQEGWVKFTRFYCKEGWIDQWVGDCADDPNRPIKSFYSLNAFSTCWRAKGTKWFPELNKGHLHIKLDKYAQEYTSDEIWQVQVENDIFDDYRAYEEIHYW